MTDQVCIVIGGGKGMGAAIAREMKKRNYKLSLMSPSVNCEKLADELDGIAYRGRAENSRDTDNLIKLTMEKFGRIDSLLIHVVVHLRAIFLKYQRMIGKKLMKWC